MAGFTVFVPGRPVSINAMYGLRRVGRSGRRRYLTQEAVDWRETVFATVFFHVVQMNGALVPPITISYRFTGIRADVDNLLKVVDDGLKRALSIDDRHFKIGSAVVEHDGDAGVFLTIEGSDGG